MRFIALCFSLPQKQLHDVLHKVVFIQVGRRMTFLTSCGRRCFKQNLCIDKMLKPKRRRSIETAISNEVAPARSKSHDLLLKLGGKQYAKLQTRGQTTPAGRFYFSQTKPTPETYDINGTVVQKGVQRIPALAR